MKRSYLWLTIALLLAISVVFIASQCPSTLTPVPDTITASGAGTAGVNTSYTKGSNYNDKASWSDEQESIT
jgi:hypothetical protein